MYRREAVCQECGKNYIATNANQKYCKGPHEATCQYCGKVFTYSYSPKDKPRYCGKKCRELGKKKLLQQQYGVDNVSQIPEVRKKISSSNGSELVKSRRANTCIQKYGVDNVSKSADIKKKLSKIMSGSEYLSSREKTCIEKYGVPYPTMTKEVIAKRDATCMERYGQVGRIFTKQHYADMMRDGSKVDEYLLFKDDPRKYIESHYVEKPSIGQLEMDLGVSNTPIYDTLVKHNCSNLIQKHYSTIETDIINFLKSIVPNTTILRNDRRIIKPLELDIYLPEYNFAIECDPAWTHNSSIKNPWSQKPLSYKYHLDKSKRAQQAGIFLFHIFGYEWNNHRQVIKSMLRNILGLNEIKIGARSTYVCELDSKTCGEFLDSNHRQGNVSAKVRLGLRLKSSNELVSVMTFSHMRDTMGKKSNDTEYDWELSRFCTRLNTTVMGAADKLFKYFLNEYRPVKVTSFSDVAHTRGALYEKLGFYKVGSSNPSYVWTDIYDNVYYHRVSCQKKNLKHLFNDENIDIEHLTEAQIMEARGFVRVYDCGVIRWEYQTQVDLKQSDIQ